MYGGDSNKDCALTLQIIIEESKADVTLEYIGFNIGFRVLIPAGSKLSRFADDHGYVCIVCLAEYYGYKNIRPDEVLRQPLL